MADRRLVIQGWIVLGKDGDYDDALYLVDHRAGSLTDPLAEQVYDATRWGRCPVSINYHVTDEPFAEDELLSMLVAKMCGVSHSGEGKAEYSHRYSELTGYLWTTETLEVGGHDVLQELRSDKGKWCFMTVTIHEVAK